MATNSEQFFVELLDEFIMATAEMDRRAAETNCSIIQSLMYNDDGTDRTTSLQMVGTDGDNINVEVPAVSTVPLSMLYVPEITFELTGTEVLRAFGTKLANLETSELSEDGKMFRQLTASLGYNTDIEVTGEDEHTVLKLTIHKDSTTMTKLMESWFENTKGEIHIKGLQKMIN